MSQVTQEQLNMRLAVVKEILDCLDTGTIKLTAFAYILFQDEGDAQKALDEIPFQCDFIASRLSAPNVSLAKVNGYPCVSCALGSMAVAAVRQGLVKNDETILDVLSRLFDPEQLTTIEAVYMGPSFDQFLFDDMLTPDNVEYEHHAELEQWWVKYGLVDENGHTREFDSATVDYDEMLQEELENLTAEELARPDAGQDLAEMRAEARHLAALEEAEEAFEKDMNEKRKAAFLAILRNIERNNGEFKVEEVS